MKCLIITQPVPTQIVSRINQWKDTFIIAVDNAVSFLIEQKIPIDLVVGDFDSLKDKNLLEGQKVIQLDEAKDETDTECAIKYATQKGGFDEIFLIGGLGGKRFEHSLANILLLSQYPAVEMITEYSHVKVLNEGTHRVTFDAYINIFSLEESVITLKGFKYPLKNYPLRRDQVIGISNELQASEGMIEVKQGKILLILTAYD